MKKSIVIVILGILFSVPFYSKAANAKGRWYKPFSSNVFASIENAMSGGNCIWFTTEYGVGQFHTGTKKTRFFSYSSMNLGYPYMPFHSFLACDSEHVTLYLEFSGTLDILQYDGVSWKKSTCPYSNAFDYFDIHANNHGVVWICSGGLNIKFDGKEWKSWSQPKDYFNRVFMVDDNGYLVVGLSTSVSGSGYIFRYNGSEEHPGLTINAPPFFSLSFFQDVHRQMWIIGRSALYKINNDTTLTEFAMKDSIELTENAIIDSDGNLWIKKFDSKDGLYKIIKIDVASQEPVFSDTLSSMDNTLLVSCDDGIYIIEKQKNDLIWYYANKAVPSVIPLNDWGDTCGCLSKENRIVFRKNGAIVTYNEMGTIVEYKNGSCHRLPTLKYTFHLLENDKGELLAYSGDGERKYVLCTLRDSAWVSVGDTSDLHFVHMVLDKPGKIWGTVPVASDECKIVHQKDYGWELIGQDNSNLLKERDPLTYCELPPFLSDKDGSIWVNCGEAVAKTSDGYHWTTYDSTNSNLPPVKDLRTYNLYNDSGHRMVVSYLDSYNKIYRFVYKDGSWMQEIINTPFSLNNIFSCFEDSKGNIWINNYAYFWETRTARYAFYRYANSEWTHYDSSNTSFSLAEIIGEDATGKIYFHDKFAETVVYDPAINNAIIQDKQNRANSLSFKNTINGKNLLIEYQLDYGGSVSLGIYSLQGRLVKTLVSGVQGPGTYTQKFTINSTPGIYLLRYCTNDKLYVRQILTK